MIFPKAVYGLTLSLVSFLQTGIRHANAEGASSGTEIPASQALVKAPEAGADPDSTSRISALEGFKAFVANPPPIEEVRFCYTGPPVYRRDERYQLHKEPAPREYFWARYRPGGVVNIRLPRAIDLNTNVFEHFMDLRGAVAIFQSQNAFWSYHQIDGSMSFWRGSSEPPIDTRNPVLLDHEVESIPLFSVFSMGPHFVRPGSMRWLGNRFETVARLNNDRFVVRGEVFPDTLGRAGKMTMRYTSATVDGRYEVDYGYTTNRDTPSFLPTRIHAMVLHGQEPYPDKDISILSLRIATNPIVAPAFQPAGWLLAPALSRFVYTNNSLFILNRDNSLQPVPYKPQLPAAAPPWVLAHTNRYYFTACVFLSSAFLILNRRLRTVPTN